MAMSSTRSLSSGAMPASLSRARMREGLGTGAPLTATLKPAQAGMADARGGAAPRMTDTAPDGLLHVAPSRRRPGRQHYKACESSSDRTKLAWIQQHPLSPGRGEPTRKGIVMPTIMTKQEMRDTLKAVEGRGKAANPETVALADTFSGWDKAYWNEPFLNVEPSELGLKAFCADVDTQKEHADGTPYTSNSRKVFESHVRQALTRASIDYTASFKESKSGKALLLLTPVKHREPKEVEVEES